MRRLDGAALVAPRRSDREAYRCLLRDWRDPAGRGRCRGHEQFGLDSHAMEEVFVPAAQMPVNFMTVVVRTGSNPAATSHTIVAAIRGLDKGQPISRRFAAFLLGLFGGLAVVLAVVGVAAVMPYTVAQRTREFGIRMAMGARPRELSRLVLDQGLRLTALGVAIGLRWRLCCLWRWRWALVYCPPAAPRGCIR